MDKKSTIAEMEIHFRVPATKSKEEAWELLQHKLNQKQQLSVVHRSSKLGFWVGSASAAAIFIALLSIGMFNTGKYSPEIQVPVAQFREISLPDESKVMLSSNSMAKYHYNKITGERNVVLDGEAYFDVKKGRKFTVDFGNGSIKVLGTSFNVSAYGPRLTEICCKTGKLEISLNGQKYKLTGGQAIKQFNNFVTGPYPVDTSDINNRQFGLFNWNVVQLNELMELIGYRFGYDVELHGSLLQRNFTGKVELNSLEESLMIIGYAMNIDYTIDESRKVILLNEKIRNLIPFLLLLLFVQFRCMPGAAQNTNAISVVKTDTPLNEILSEITLKYNIRFAYDYDLVSRIQATISVKNVTIEQFLLEIGNKYGFKYRWIGGSYVLTKIALPIKDPAKPITRNSEIKQISKEEQPVALPSLPQEETKPKEYTFSGTVSNRASGDKIAHCHIIFNHNIHVFTNELGNFTATFISEEKIQLTIRHLGYKTLSAVVAAKPNLMMDIKLTPVEIYTSKTISDPLFRASFDYDERNTRTLINPEILRYIPSYSSRYQSIYTFAGTKVLPFYATSSSRVNASEKIILDGIPVLSTSFLGYAFRSGIIRNNIQHINVPGASDYREFGTLPGLILLSTKNGMDNKPTAELRVNPFEINGQIGIPISKKVSIAGSVQQTLGAITPLLLTKQLYNKDSFHETGSPNKLAVNSNNILQNASDANAKILIKPNRNHEISLSYLFGKQKDTKNIEFNLNNNNLSEYSQNNVRNGYGAIWKIQSTPRWFNKISAAHSNLIQERTSSHLSNLYIEKDYDRTILSKSYAQWKSSFETDSLTHEFGADLALNNLGNRYWQQIELTDRAFQKYDSLNRNQQSFLLNGYYAARWQYNSRLKFIGGLRTSYSVTQSKLFLLPNASGHFALNEKTHLGYSFGMDIQSLYSSVLLDQNMNMRQIWYLPDNTDEFQRIQNHQLDYSYTLGSLEINLNLFHSSFRNYTTLVHNDLKLEYTGQTFDRLKTSSIHSGFDFIAQYRQGYLHHMLSYSFSNSMQKLEGFNDNGYFPSLLNRPHQFNLTEMIRREKWIASISCHMASGLMQLKQADELSWLKPNKTRNLMQVDLFFCYRSNWKKVSTETGINIQNLFNHRNELFMDNINHRTGNHIVATQAIFSAPGILPIVFLNLRY
jgi:transmembrane sensor